MWKDLKEFSLKRFALFNVVFWVFLAVDQVTKNIATDLLKGQPMLSYFGDTFRWTYATNQGAFLSLGAGLPPRARFWVLTVIVGLMLTALAFYALVKRELITSHVVGYALLVSGGASNWFDRARSDGSVVDFMNVGIGSLRSGVFNVADLVIIAGIVCLFLGGNRAAAPAS